MFADYLIPAGRVFCRRRQGESRSDRAQVRHLYPQDRQTVFCRRSCRHISPLGTVELSTCARRTDRLSDVALPTFDRNGKYLYFTASTDVGPALASSMGVYKLPVTRSGYLIVLSQELKSPWRPKVMKKDLNRNLANLEPQTDQKILPTQTNARQNSSKKANSLRKAQGRTVIKAGIRPRRGG